MFATHQARLVRELALFGITDMAGANRYLREQYLPAFNAEFMQPAIEQGSSFVACDVHQIDDILCEHFERTVGKDSCVSFEGLKLQIPQDRARMHYVKVKVRVLRYPDGELAVMHGPRLLAQYTADGQPLVDELKKAEPSGAALPAVLDGYGLRPTPPKTAGQNRTSLFVDNR